MLENRVIFGVNARKSCDFLGLMLENRVGG